MTVAAVLADQVGGPPQTPGRRLRALYLTQTAKQGAARAGHAVDSAEQDVRDPAHVRVVAQDLLQSLFGPGLTGRQDLSPRRGGATPLVGGGNEGRLEDPEGGHHHRRRRFAERRRSAPHVTVDKAQTEGLHRLAGGGEALGRQGLEGVAEPASRGVGNQTG